MDSCSSRIMLTPQVVVRRLFVCLCIHIPHLSGSGACGTFEYSYNLGALTTFPAKIPGFGDLVIYKVCE